MHFCGVQAQFVDAQLAVFIPTDILADTSFSAEMDLNDVMVGHCRQKLVNQGA